MITLQCRKHPKYKAIFAPRRTTKHPDGCPGCNLMWGACMGSGKYVFIQRPL